MRKYLLPRIALADLPIMFGASIIAALIAGAYGVLHDQITYSISPEYFTKFKFYQFQYADLGWGERGFVAAIGFLATWWVGFVAAWFLSRRLIPQCSRRVAVRQIGKGIACIALFVLTFGMIGYMYGIWLGPSADYSSSEDVLKRLGVTDVWAFMRVAYIHNAGYLGGLIGLAVVLVWLKPQRVGR
jgi:hypothetical protein